MDNNNSTHNTGHNKTGKGKKNNHDHDNNNNNSNNNNTINNNNNNMSHLDNVLHVLAYVPLIMANLLWCLVVRLLVPNRWLAKDVSQDVVLITGAGSGLGQALAVEFAKLGASIVCWDINANGMELTRQLVAEVQNNDGATCHTYLVDVSDRDSVQEGASLVHKDLNRGRCEGAPQRYVSILVNNAGIYHGLMLHELRDQQIERIFKINCLAHFWTVRAFIEPMIDNKRGHIVEIASMAGISGLQKQVDYCATKFATIGFEEALHMELEWRQMSQFVKSTVVCPFFFSSNLFTQYKSNINDLMSSHYVAKETVQAVRCNQTMIMLPGRAYLNYLLKTLLPRETFVLCTKAMGYSECVRDIKGAAALASM